jgi:hypothetical protein
MASTCRIGGAFSYTQKEYHPKGLEKALKRPGRDGRYFVFLSGYRCRLEAKPVDIPALVKKAKAPEGFH